MSTTPPKDSVAPPAKSPRAKILLTLMILMGAALGWDYWKLSCHDKSLARLQAELERRKALKLTLPRSEVEALLFGSPKKISNTEATETDFYSWQGWIYQRHLSVQYDAAEMIVKAEDEPEIPPLMEDTLRLLGQKPTPPPARKVSQEEVDAALARAEQAYRQQGGDQSGVFRESLREVFEALPEIKLSTIKGQLNWNSFRFSRQKQRLFAFRFTVPQADPVELDYVRWTSAAGYWGIITRGRALSSGSRGEGQREVDQYYELLRERKRYDIEANLELEGIGRLEHAGFGARSLKSDWPEKNFILWFESVNFDPTMDFELKTVVFASPAGKAPMRRGLHEISDHIGLRTNVPRVAATPEGVRDALTALGRLDGFSAYSPATFDRTLRPILKHLPEVTVSTTLGEARWQKVEFPHGRYAAVRVRIPESLSGEVDLYGAILGTQPSQLGWFCHDWAPDELQSRYMENASTSDPLPAPPNRLTLFSQTKGVVEPGQEVALAIYQFEDSLQARAPMFVTLTAVPHEKSERGTWPRLNAQDYPWSCGKLLGFDAPKPLEPTGCRVLGWHEMNMTHLMFSPDSRRLVSVDLRGDARVWNVESQKLESEFLDHKLKLAYDNAGSVLIAPDSRTLLTFDTDRRAISGWNLDTQERTFVRDVRALQKGQETLQAAAFGSLPDEVAMVLQKGTRLQSQGQTARFIFGNIDNGEVTETPLVVARFASQMLYLPSRELFAVGFIQQRADPISQQPQSVSVVRLYSEDFSRLIHELPLGTHPIERPDQADNSVRLSLTPDSRRLAAIDTRGQLKVWDVTTKTELLSKSVQPKTVEFLGKIPSPQALRDVSLSPDGETVTTTSPHENSVTRWNIADGQPRPTWQTDEIEVTHVAHSHDGKWVATANNDGVIRLWKNTYLDPSFRPFVADIAKSENVGTSKPRPSAIARINQLNQFVGKWNGKWDDRFQVQITITKTDSSELELLYEWEENVGQPMKRLGPQKAKIESNILVWGSIEMTFESDDPTVAKVSGKFQSPQGLVHQEIVLRRESR